MATSVELKADASGQLKAVLPGGIEPGIERAPAPLSGLIVRLPDGEPSTLVLLRDQTSVVWLNRTVGHLKSVPYVLGYDRWERDGQTHEDLTWSPAYRAEGRLKLPGCEVNLFVLDSNGDGVFDRKDYRVSTIGIDLNNDGRVSGASEYRMAGEIIDVCGVPLEMSDLDPSGLSITFRVSEFKAPAVNSPVPSFSVTTNQGELIRSADFRGKVHVLDFWASWCAPCVAKLVDMESVSREHPKDLTVIGINVDEPERRAVAERLIRQKALSFRQVIRAQGERDFLWKMFGSMQDVRMSIPLYVVVDAQGVIRYAGNGGENLAELKHLLQQLVRTNVKD